MEFAICLTLLCVPVLGSNLSYVAFLSSLVLAQLNKFEKLN